MDKDCRLFFETFVPFLVADWDGFASKFPEGHYQRLAHVLYLILKPTKESRLSFPDIDTPTIESFYDANSELYSSLEITKDNFIGCWQAVYSCESSQTVHNSSLFSCYLQKILPCLRKTGEMLLNSVFLDPCQK